jgi:hypothetical protein
MQNGISKLKIILSVLLFVYLCSCTNTQIENTSVYFSNKDLGNPIELKGEVLPNDSLWKPSNIYVVDSMIVLIDSDYGDSFVQVYDKECLNLIVENVPKGIGPNESINCRTLQIEEDYIWASDLQSRIMKAYLKDDFLTKSNVAPQKSTSFNEQFYRLVALSNNNFVGASLTDVDNLLCLYDHHGVKNRNVKVSYPKIIGEGRTDTESLRLFENRIFYSEKNHKIIVIYIYSDLIDIYDESLNLLSRIYGPDHFLPVLKFSDNYAYLVKDKTKFTYTQARMTSNEIWALYNGISPSDDLSVTYPNKIFVFDFAGKPLRSYILDYPVFDFDIDEVNKTIFCLSETQEINIIKYQL